MLWLYKLIEHQLPSHNSLVYLEIDLFGSTLTYTFKFFKDKNVEICFSLLDSIGKMCNFLKVPYRDNFEKKL